MRSQNWYSVIARWSGSLTANRLEAASVTPGFFVRFEVVTTGGGGAAMLMLNGAHTALSAALQLTPSNARTSSAFQSVPVTNVTSLSCAAVTSSSV